MTWSPSRSWWGLEDLVVPAAVLLLVNSFLPWYALRWSTLELDTGRTTEHAVTASAWSSSTGWSTSILLALTAAAAWKIHTPRLGPPQPARFIGVTLAATAVIVAASTWAAIPPAATAGSQTLAFQPLPPSGTALGHITRDALTARQTNVTTGFYVGIGLMAIIALAIYTVDRRLAPPSI